MIAYGPWLLQVVPTVIVCWSRAELGDHTRAQVIWGAVVGLLTGGTSFFLLIGALNRCSLPIAR